MQRLGLIVDKHTSLLLTRRQCYVSIVLSGNSKKYKMNPQQGLNLNMKSLFINIREPMCRENQEQIKR